ncbi:MAG TPA: hypothetical protein VH333_16865 [Pseudonocardiaceae bacterium]|nr:hypothetical protein [Pseudonocardiaceae bacterium]
MIDSYRTPYGDRQAAWARICDGFHDIQDRAARFGYDQRLATLVESTRQGDRRIVLWHALLGDIAARAADARLMTWRDPGSAAAAWPSALDWDRSGFVCPDNLCNRRAAPSLGERPRCALLCRTMTDLGSDNPRSPG